MEELINKAVSMAFDCMAEITIKNGVFYLHTKDALFEITKNSSSEHIAKALAELNK